MAYELRTFQDIWKAVIEEVKELEGDTVALNRIKRDINIIYLTEICPFRPWPWLRGQVDLTIPQFISTGTVTMVEGSTTVTFSSAPVNSQRNMLFFTDAYEDIYKILAHTAGSTTAYLDRPYLGPSASGLTYKIFQDWVPLPPVAKSTFRVTHKFLNQPLTGYGMMDFLKLQILRPKQTGRPTIYSTSEYTENDNFEEIDDLPASASRNSTGVLKSIVFGATLGATGSTLLSVGDIIQVTGGANYRYNGQNFIITEITTTTTTNDTIKYVARDYQDEADTADLTFSVQRLVPQESNAAFRKLFLFPSLYEDPTTLSVFYTKDVLPLEDASDEPLIPYEDRVILLYGALHREWSRLRNPEEAQRNYGLYTDRRDRMAAKADDSVEMPRLTISKVYLQVKRSTLRYNEEGYDDRYKIDP